ncbi:MAG: BadM/Rrf2 family transcriptional regulator [Puniceicoccaceae bacterium 5H]|nr:MAG: BadM/Rrf2 family transcriptional regulator [Puniceicoccaceae bacterium 5H]
MGIMKLSLKVGYACQVLAQLGRAYGQAELPHIEDLASAEQIPQNYLVQILNELRNAGVIISKRGKQGGYALARSPREITLYDIVCAVEGELLGFSTSSEGESARNVQQVWSEVVKNLEQQTRGFTVEDLMRTAAEEMYYI